MRINCDVLKNVDSYNDFQIGDKFYVSEGIAQKLYFRLKDLDRDSLRYIPKANATINVLFVDAANVANKITIAANMKYSTEDRSVWEISLTDAQIPVSGNVFFELSEDAAIVAKWTLKGGVTVTFQNSGSC